jgi:Xaa-Pro aminopeptidase
MEKPVLDKRVEKLRAALDEAGLRAVILSRPQHIFYFTGIQPGPSPALLVVTKLRVMGIAPAPLGTCETITYPDYDIHLGWNAMEAAAQALDQALSASFPLGRIVGLELDHLPAAFMPVALRHLREPRDAREMLWKIRRIKDAQELAQIEANVAGNDRVFQALSGALHPGMEALDAWRVIQNTLCANAGAPVVLEGDLGAGVRGSNPDAKPGHVQLQAGETIFVDIYSATNGYYADTTRVFSLGQPDDRQREIYSVLRQALQAGEGTLRAGSPANMVDAAVRGVIEKAGYGPNFPHHSGHAYGLFQQEKPYLIPAETIPLEAGMIITLEPGIYLPGWGGMRLEGNYLIQEDGARRLDQFPSDIITCE